MGNRVFARARGVCARVLVSALLVGLVGLAGGGCTYAPAVRVGLKPAATVLATSRVEVPMRVGPSGLPEVQAEVGGQPVRAVVDMGAFAAVLSPELASRAQLHSAGLMLDVVDAGGYKRRTVLVEVPACKVGAATFTDFAAVQNDLAPLSSTAEPRGTPPFDFVLSPMMFRDALVTIDYVRGRLVVEQGELPPPDGWDVLQLLVTRGGQLMVPVRVAGRDMWVQLDTGCTPGLVVPYWQLGAFPGAETAIATGEVTYYHGKGAMNVSRLSADAQIGRHVIQRPLFCTTAAGEAPTLGGEYLKHFAVTIDQRHGRVRFARSGAAPIAVPAPPMLAMHWKKETGIVVAVKEGGAAERAGVRVGDQILAVEGIWYTEFAAGKLPRWVKRPGYLQFDLIHPDRRTLRVDVPIREMMPGEMAAGG